MKRLLLLAAFAECANAASTLPPVLPVSRAHAGLENPDSVTEALYTIELRSLQDIRMLDAGERAEMFASLQAMGVGLGSRAKLRRLAYASSVTVERSAGGLNADWTVTQLPELAIRRQLQQSGGSMDSIALGMTALLGIASYLVQAKISRDAEKSQKESDRAHADSARAETKAEQQLVRVMTGMESFVAPLSAWGAQFNDAFLNTMGEVGLAGQIEHWKLAWLEVLAAPHIEVCHLGNPAFVGASLKSPYFKLAPQDITVLESDPATRQRCEGRSLYP
jgi:hypothetical protein